MKLSFSLPPKSKSRVTPISDRNDAVGEGNLKKFVTEFDPTETLTDAKPKYIIPPLEDRRTKSIDFLPHPASGLKFEAEIPSGDGENIAYGLNVRDKLSKAEPVEQMLLKSLRKDLESLPDAPILEDFESVPVEGFGEALLAGYGWKPGQGIGLNAKEDIQIVQHKKWTDHEGFGFLLDKPKVKGKETCKLDVSVVGGRQVALEGKMMIEKLGSGCHGETKIVDNKYRIAAGKRSRETERGNRREIRACKENDRGRSRETRERASWLRSHIRVRIVSKELKGGRLYLKKGVVTDVVGPTTCDITMDKTRELVQGIDHKFLETALPRRGGQVLILSGRHKGIYGSLVEKDLDKETGVVCDADSQEMLHVNLEQVAEYMGDPGCIGY